MKQSVKLYLRAALLGFAAALLIDGMLHADEVRAAFAAGKTGTKAAQAISRVTSGSWLNIPAHAAKVAGWCWRIID